MKKKNFLYFKIITVTCDEPIHHFTIAQNFSIDVNEVPVELGLASGYVLGQFHTIDPDLFAVNQTFEYI
jgi:hypothetical protein